MHIQDRSTPRNNQSMAKWGNPRQRQQVVAPAALWIVFFTTPRLSTSPALPSQINGLVPVCACAGVWQLCHRGTEALDFLDEDVGLPLRWLWLPAISVMIETRTSKIIKGSSTSRYKSSLLFLPRFTPVKQLHSLLKTRSSSNLSFHNAQTQEHNNRG